MDENKWGQYFWGVTVARSLDKSGFIYINADSVKVQHGALIFFRNDANGIDARDTEALKEYRGKYVGPTHIFAPGQWSQCFAASCLTGAPVAVDRVKE